MMTSITPTKLTGLQQCQSHLIMIADRTIEPTNLDLTADLADRTIEQTANLTTPAEATLHLQLENVKTGIWLMALSGTLYL